MRLRPQLVWSIRLVALVVLGIAITTMAVGVFATNTMQRPGPDRLVLSTETALAMPTATALAMPTATATVTYATPSNRLFGVLQAEPRFADTTRAAGVNLRTIDVVWSRFEPREGTFDVAYTEQMQREFAQARDLGYQIVLGLGVQYPPEWVWEYPNSRFVNQWGEEYRPTTIGANGLNAVFNNEMRVRQARFVEQVFRAFGTDFYAVHLGWGYYGELNYPKPFYGDRTNSYWAYDALAQGKANGLPAGIAPSPVVGWLPGSPSPDHQDAALFAEWYMASLQNYHDWQITTVRALYPGRLLMLYSSWGLRPGQLAEAVAHDLGGSTSPELNGEVQRGFDVARFMAGIRDPQVVVYTTWIDADDTGDDSDDQRHWSPVHYLAYLAQQHPLRLAVWGQNTGRGTSPMMQRSFKQMQRYGLETLVWAFEEDLYNTSLASLDEYGTLIRTQP